MFHYRKSRRFFTLIELMICIVLLMITSGFFGLQIHDMIKTIQVKKAIKTIESHLELCKKASLLQQCDMIFSLVQEDDMLKCQMGYDGGHGLYRGTEPLKKNFRAIEFKFPGKDKKVEFCFSSTGTVHPKGNLELIGCKGKIKRITTISNRYITNCTLAPIHPFNSEAFREKERQTHIPKS